MAEGRGGDSDKIVLKQALKKKIGYLLKKPNISPVEAYNVIKRFFQAFTGNDYEYTREELIEELDKVYLEEDKKLRLTQIILRLGEVEFSRPQYSRDEIEGLLNEFSQIVDDMVHEEGMNFGFWDKMARKLKSHVGKEEDEGEEPKSPAEEFLKEVEEESSEEPPLYDSGDDEPDDQAPWSVPPHEKEGVTEEELADNEFAKLFGEFRENIQKGDVIMAKLDYEEMKHAYEKMSHEEKHRHYDRLKEAYERLENMMGN